MHCNQIKDAGADITEVFTREGDDAILPCALDSPVDLTDEAFDLKKGKQEVFFYIQGKDYNEGREGQDPQFVGRVRLLQGGLQAGNASVVLSSVTQADSGVYNFVILTRPTHSHRYIQLTVVVEPRLSVEVVEAPPSSGWMRLSCVSRGGQPQPSGLEWQTPNGTVIPAEEAPPAASSDSDGRYSISQTVKVTEPGSYTCLARQQGVHPAVRDTIQVFGHWLTGDHEEVLRNERYSHGGVLLFRDCNTAVNLLAPQHCERVLVDLAFSIRTRWSSGSWLSIFRLSISYMGLWRFVGLLFCSSCLCGPISQLS
ncbi:unnamed protein product [Arctogadus glacialis]